MRDVANEGRTVLFVSHNQATVQALCTRAVHLDAGRVVNDGPTADVIDQYLTSLEDVATTNLLERTDRSTRAYQELKLSSVSITGGAGGGALATGRAATIGFELTGLGPTTSVSFVVHDHFGLPIASFDSKTIAPQDTREPALGAAFVCEIDHLPLAPGRYRVDAEVRADNHLQDSLEAVAYFDVAPGTLDDRPATGDSGAGPVVVAHRWRVPPS
jgi:lipopolysaccharide transport system ATP-binding protein